MTTLPLEPGAEPLDPDLPVDPSPSTIPGSDPTTDPDPEPAPAPDGP